MVVGVSTRRRCCRARCFGRSRRRCGWHGHGHRVSGVASTTAGLGTQGVVQRPPIAGVHILPRPVVRKGGLVAQRRSSRLRIRWIRSSRLGQRGQGQAKRHDGRQPANEVVHRSKPCDSSARRRRSQKSPARPRTRRRTSPVRPPSEALMGQMVRGGRSWPSETKLGAGVDRSGNLTLGSAMGSGRRGGSVNKGVSEQKAEHMLHLSATPWS